MTDRNNIFIVVFRITSKGDLRTFPVPSKFETTHETFISVENLFVPIPREKLRLM